MNKAELAQYLVNLHILIGAQNATGVASSQVLSAEYERNWTLLKEEINKDETRNGQQSERRPEARTDLTRREHLERG